MAALEKYNNYDIIFYEETCLNLNEGLSPIAQHIKLKELPDEINENYKLNRRHLDTNQNSEKKRIDWQNKLSNQILMNMQQYFDFENFEEYKYNMLKNNRLHPWWQRMFKRIAK
jgi:hypothetical protein